MTFPPGRMSFDEYFGWGQLPEEEKALRFLPGLPPWAPHIRDLADRSRVDLAARRDPSTVIACQLCPGVAGEEVLKILLGRGPVWCTPDSVQFDAYRNELVTARRRGGYKDPLSRLAPHIARRQLAQLRARRP